MSEQTQESESSNADSTVLDATRSWAMHTSPAVPTSRTLVILGEAPGADEEATGVPFVGSAGRQLTESFDLAGLTRDNWHILNTFLQRPPNNDLALVTKDSGVEDLSLAWTLNKTQFKKEYGYGPPPTLPALKKRYLRPVHQWQIAELQTRLRVLKPDLILAMGATALWALTGQDAITQHRGNFFLSPYGQAIATFHPASILYQYSNMPLLWADLTKVRLWLEGKLPRPLRRRLWINPSSAEIAAYYARLRANPSALVGVDIETCPSIGQITTVAFSTETEGLCIPFWDRHCYEPAKQNYWPTVAAERIAWRWVERFARLPNPKVMQNGLYDAQYFMDAPIDIRLTNYRNDTSVLQHSYQPELPKALGVLGSLYLNEPSWKQMRASAKDMNKADE